MAFIEWLLTLGGYNGQTRTYIPPRGKKVRLAPHFAVAEEGGLRSTDELVAGLGDGVADGGI